MKPPYKAFIAIVRAPLYSVKRPEAYQTGVSLPLPQPSTLVGALARAAAIAEGNPAGLPSGVAGDDYVRELTEWILGKLELVRAVAKPVGFLARSSFMLSRVRALEESGKDILSKMEKGRRIADAMVREYYWGRLALMYVFKGDIDSRRVLTWLSLLERLGDTESLVSPERVGEAKLEPLGSEGDVDTYTPVKWVESYDGEVFSLERLCEEKLCAVPIRDVGSFREFSSVYLVPLVERAAGRGRVILEGSKVRVRVAKDYGIWRVEGAGVAANIVLPVAGESR